MRKRIIYPFLFAAALGFLFALPHGVEAASLNLSPSSGSFTVGSTFNVSVVVNSSGVAINAAQATVRFPTDKLEISALAKAGTFTLWTVEPTYSNSDGQVIFAGGLPNPGYTGSAGRILTITFHAKAEGNATVTITGGKVLANDGQGTNVLTSQGSGTYTITAAAAPEPEKNLPAAPTVSSSTHPDQNQWYAKSDPAFQWTTQNGVTGYSFSLDDKETAAPDTVQDGSDSSKSFTGIADGVWYFHVRAQNTDGWGPAGHFRVRIDTTPPAPFSIFALLASDNTPNVERQVSFETTDAASGVHHYTLRIDEDAEIDIDAGSTTPYTLPKLTAGQHLITAKAIDFAGNTTTATATLVIGAAPGQVVPGETPPTTPAKPTTPSEALEAIIPTSVIDFADKVLEPIQRVLQNPEIAQITNDVLEPASTAAVALTAAGLVTSTATVELTNVLYLFFRFGYFWLVPITFGKKRKPWGVVFDSTTGRPIKNAVVRIFSAEFNKLKESQLTDAQGRFGFLVDIGEYYVTATHPGYMFPSRILQTAMVSQYEHIYRGDKFEIKERIEGTVQIDVPLDPDMGMVSAGRIRWLRILNFLGLILEKMNIPLLIGGTLISWFTLVFYPKPVNYLIMGLYAVLIAMKVILRKRVQRSWGLVRNAESKSAVDLAVVRIYDMTNGRVIGTRITNTEGKFTSLVPPGKYYVVVTKVGFMPYQSSPIGVKRKRAMIRVSIFLTPQSAQAPSAPVSLPISPIS